MTGQSNETACVACEPGYYCASPGLDWPTDKCDPGWYCILGSELAQPSDVSQGGSCVAGSEILNLNLWYFWKQMRMKWRYGLFTLVEFYSGTGTDYMKFYCQ